MTNQHETGLTEHARWRRGMTLLELMLVMALLVVLGALALPSLQVPFENQKLRKAGDVVRIQWNKARIKAMKSGQIQMFCYEAEQGTFSTQPYYSAQDILESDAQHSSSAMASGGMAAEQQQDQIDTQPKELPEGVVFASSEVQSDARSLQLQQQTQSGPMGNQSAGGVMDALQSPPILFYPDGTTSDAKLVLTNELQRLYVVISLRSLTGVARVSELVSADEVQLVP